MNSEHVTTSIAEAVSERRIELGLTKSELCRRARLTRSTLHEIENGTRRNLMPATYEALDGALEWLPGTLRRLTMPKRVPPPLPSSLRVPRLQAHLATLREALDEREQLDQMYKMLVDVVTDLAEAVAAMQGQLLAG